MNKKYILAYVGLLSLWWGVQALADYQAALPNGPNVTFDAVTNGAKQIPKRALTDATGILTGTSASPLYSSITSGGNSATITPAGAIGLNLSQINGSNISNANALPITQNVGGAAVSASNPVPIQLSQGGGVVSAANGIPTQLVNGGLAVGSSNPLPVTTVTAEPATYSFGSGGITVAANASDVLILQGSASKVIKIKRMTFGLGVASSSYFSIIRRSSAFSGGTCPSQTASIVKHDTNDAASTTGGLWVCSANPTVGTLVGKYRSFYLPPQINSYQMEFSGVNDKALTLRGTSDYLAINLEASNASNSMLFSIEWTEE